MDALWPSMDPDSAVNSLNQTIYFLRRVFEPDYDEDSTAGYIRQQSDIVWADRDLIASRSARCHELIRRLDSEQRPDVVETLSKEYVGKFALDFAYEEWAADYRDSLHVAYLHTIETAIREDLRSGHFDRGIRLARRGFQVDSQLENLDIPLIRMLKEAGAHAAAAEQYSRYESTQRAEYGVAPPSLDSL